MIIIDRDAEKQLLQALKHGASEQANMGIIHFCFAAQDPPAFDLLSRLPQLLRQEISDKNPRIFCCGPDTWILAENSYAREAHKLAIAVANIFNIAIIKDNFGFYELREHGTRIISQLESKLELEAQKLLAEEALVKKQTALAQLERRRQDILSIETDSTTRTSICDKRKGRDQLSIMVIEDDAFSRRLVEKILARDHLLTLLGSTELALPTYRHTAPDILFLDINLPDVSGHELLEKIMQLDPEAYVVMLSGNADRDNITEAMKRGAKGFIAKPFTAEKLQQYIQRCPTIH